MKHYKKFYEIDNNRYYTIVADDDLFIATESFLKLDKKKLFRKQKELVTGFKLLKLSACIAHLFKELDNLKPCTKQKYDTDDLIVYEHINNIKLKAKIQNSYEQVIKDEINYLEELKEQCTKEGKTEFLPKIKEYLDKLSKVNPMEGIDLVSPNFSGCNLIRTMLRDGHEHLYTERVNAFTNNVYLYNQDEFGTLTIYRIITIKNVVKTIDTFIYDKKLIECLLKTLYEEGR